MLAVDNEIVSHIRAASRRLVRELGFMNRTLAGTDYSASAVHAVIEIGAAGRISAKALSEILLLEKSTVSRLVQSLVVRGLVCEARSEGDGRSKDLFLTGAGERLHAEIAAFAESRVRNALGQLPPDEQLQVAEGMGAYSHALAASRTGAAVALQPDAQILTGFKPGLIGRIAEMHGTYYNRHYGFGPVFEAKVAAGVAEFAPRLTNSCNEIWHIESYGRIAGSLAVDGEDLGGGRAHLRWFILEDGLRGTGLGNELVKRAVAFCDACGFGETHLWTFSGLDAARRLYERHGFRLTEEYHGDQWGTRLLEQRFVRTAPSNAGQ
ncbi:MarR family transcriptional regulator [Stappia sp. F7233]|uniref:MarR family transcriptional regulator n=2 Tax=Stappia albiluteola TaxID=2758565 RepID=A0A839AAY1_9HYPH|nr:MarR family transcriptional regulator [Stappia albiluteola]